MAKWGSVFHDDIVTHCMVAFYDTVRAHFDYLIQPCDIKHITL